MPRRPVTDHRGQIIGLFGLPGKQSKADTREAIPKDVHRRIERHVGKRVAAAKFATFIVGVILYVFAVGALGFASSWMKIPQSTFQLVVIVMFFIGSGLIYAAEQAVVHRVFTFRIIAAFLSEGRCPLCAYDLAAAEPEPDACVVCPECGAAWRLLPAPGTH